jgi:Putative esterase
MNRSRTWVLIVCLTTMAWVIACRNIPKYHEAEPSAELLRQVSAYLRADDHEADRLLLALSDRPVPELESALRRTLEDSFQKSVSTGMMVGRSISVADESLSYGLYVPPNYDPSRAYPLVICLHGAGFNGDTYLDRWRPRLGDDYILACPTLEDADWWTRRGETLVLAVLSQLSRTYHLDPDRVFLTGMSNGGVGTYLIGLNHPDRFAALIPMAGALPSELFPMLDNALNTPLYIIHGAKDQVMPVQNSRDVAARLNRNGYPVVYREHDHVHPLAGGHFFPREELPDLLVWMKTQRRIADPREVAMVRDRDHPGRSFWIRIDEIDPEAGSFRDSEKDPEESRRLQQGAYARLDARLSGNTIYVAVEHVIRYSLLIPRHFVNLAKPLVVFTNGRISFEQILHPDGRSLLEEARRLPDPRQLAISTVRIKVSP